MNGFIQKLVKQARYTKFGIINGGGRQFDPPFRIVWLVLSIAFLYVQN